MLSRCVSLAGLGQLPASCSQSIYSRMNGATTNNPRRFPYAHCFADNMRALDAKADSCAIDQGWDAAEIASCANGEARRAVDGWVGGRVGGCLVA